MGHLRFLVFYLACAAAGALCHGLLSTVSEAPLVGASGAISGVVAAYLMLHPRVRVWVLVFFRVPLPLPAFIPLLFWVGQQFFMLLADANGNVSWGAHVGGIIAGALLVFILRRPGVPLFDRQIVTPRAVQDRPIPIRVTASGMPAPPRLPWGGTSFNIDVNVNVNILRFKSTDSVRQALYLEEKRVSMSPFDNRSGARARIFPEVSVEGPSLFEGRTP